VSSALLLQETGTTPRASPPNETPHAKQRKLQKPAEVVELTSAMPAHLRPVQRQIGIVERRVMLISKPLTLRLHMI
jgi:hypothetical protein